MLENNKSILGENNFSPCTNNSLQSINSSLDFGSKCSPIKETPEIPSPLDTESAETSAPSNTVITVVKHISNFLCVDDVGSLCSLIDLHVHSEPGESQPPELIGLSFESDSFDDDRLDYSSQYDQPHDTDQIPMDDDDDLQQRRFQQKYLRDSIFQKDNSLRSLCLLANELSNKTEAQAKKRYNLNQAQAPETQREPLNETLISRREALRKSCFTVRCSAREKKPNNFINSVLSKIFHNVPLSVAIDVSEAIFGTSAQSTIAIFTISAASIQAVLAVLAHIARSTFHKIQSFNPFHHSNIANPYITSSQGITISAGSHQKLSNIFFQNNYNYHTHHDRTNIINEKILRKLNRYDSTAKVISYMEREDDTLTEHAKKRVQQMMHYQVPLRPFVATVMAIPDKQDISPINNQLFSPNLFSKRTNNHRFPSKHTSLRSLLDKEHGRNNNSKASNSNGNGSNNFLPSSASSSSFAQLSASESPFMCTPKSFPPSPSSRSLVMERGTRFADDVVFLARDQLRVEGALGSANARTRAMAKALREGSRLAVFNAQDAGNGIHLTCGQHCVSKISTALYCSMRSMIPILRNCYVYFEMTVLPPVHASLQQHQTLASLAIGLSTLEMPLNTLVGSWKSSAGLCTNGQILTGGQWCSPLDPHYCAYGNNSTIGCLVRLDDDQAFQTWDGHMVTASITFNVNSHLVNLPLCGVAPVGGGNDLSLYCGSDTSYTGMHSHELNPRSTPENTLRLLVPREQEIFPTVTLNSTNTQVMCRFSSEDIRALKRESIGAPRGVTVYAVDGSVLFDESDDMHFPPSSQDYPNDELSTSMHSSGSLEDLEFDDHYEKENDILSPGDESDLEDNN